MPLTKKGQKILASMKSQYGAKKGLQVFHASKNAGTITGVEKGGSMARKKHKMPKKKKPPTRKVKPKKRPYRKSKR